MYPDYLIHFNKNHSSKNGRFTSGDGDGDGIANDHSHSSKRTHAGHVLEKIGRARKDNSDRILHPRGDHGLSDRSGFHFDDNKRNFDKQSNQDFRDKIVLNSRMRRAINNGQAFIGDIDRSQPMYDWADEQKVSGKDAANIYMQRQFGYALADMYEEDEEERKKKKSRVTRTTNSKYWKKNQEKGQSSHGGSVSYQTAKSYKESNGR